MALANRLDFQFYTQGQHGGYTFYPFSGVVNGLKVENAVPSADPGTTIAFDVTAGSVRLDSALLEAPAMSGISIDIGASVREEGNDTAFGIYLNPQRTVPAVLTLPETGTEGDQVIKVYESEYVQYAEGFFRYNGTAWVKINPIEAAPNYHHNNMPFHNLQNQVVEDMYSDKPELVIYHGNNIPAYVYSPSKAYVRKSASIKLADVEVVTGPSPVITIKRYQDDTIASI